MRNLTNLGVIVALCAAALAIGLLFAAAARVSAANVPGFAARATVAPTPASAVLAEAASPEPTAAPTQAPPAATPRPASTPTLAPARTLVLAPTSAPPTLTPGPAYAEYTVRKGDLLYTIAARNGVRVADILAINQIANPDSLSVGQVLRIPAHR